MNFKFFLISYVYKRRSALLRKRNLTITAKDLGEAYARILAENKGWEISMFWPVYS